MKKVLSAILIVGFAFVDILFFHDALKPGEVTTLPQYLTGVLSIPAMLLAAQVLFNRKQHSRI